MTAITKEKIYNVIVIFCTAVCILLIGRVAADELTGGREKDVPRHVPPAVREGGGAPAETEEPDAGWIRIDTQTLEQELGKYLEELPLQALEISVAADGALGLSAELSRDALQDYCERNDMQLPGGGLVQMLAPETIELELELLCSRDDESGMITVAPRHICLAGVDVDVSELPSGCFSGINTALNRMLLASAGAFSGVSFADWQILLAP